MKNIYLSTECREKSCCFSYKSQVKRAVSGWARNNILPTFAHTMQNIPLPPHDCDAHPRTDEK
jgi:hypothetical protein